MKSFSKTVIVAFLFLMLTPIYSQAMGTIQSTNPLLSQTLSLQKDKIESTRASNRFDGLSLKELETLRNEIDDAIARKPAEKGSYLFFFLIVIFVIVVIFMTVLLAPTSFDYEYQIEQRKRNQYRE